jgi:hypothetical protein
LGSTASVPDCYADQYFTTVSRLPQNDGQDDITNRQENDKSLQFLYFP